MYDKIYISVPNGELGPCHYDGVISAEGKKRLVVLCHIFSHKRTLPGVVPVDSNNT
jgi:hypothetical protein